MLPPAIRALIALAARLVPRPARAEWIQDWHQELERRAEAGATREELRARGRHVVRDALWVRKRAGYNPFTAWLSRPFRTELLLAAAAGGVWLYSGSLTAREMPFPAADQVVIMERGISSLGARRPLMSRELANQSAGLASFAELAAFNFWYRTTPAAGYVSRNFFDVLGAEAELGHTFAADSAEKSVVVTHHTWVERFSADPGVIGRTIEIGGPENPHTVIGVLPESFRFERQTQAYFVPLPEYLRTVGAVARLAPGVTLGEAEQEFRRLAVTVEPDWSAEAFALRQPIPPASREWLLALSLGLVAFLGSAAYVGVKGVRGLRYYLALAARLLLVLASFSALQAVLTRLVLRQYWVPSIAPTWIFLVMCMIAVILVVRDHLDRCPVCLERLDLPVSLGIWSSVVMDPPATEYVCPNGHGLLYTPESGQTDNKWTTLDASWNDLFQRRD